MATLSTEGMETLPASKTVQPFGKVNVWQRPDGTKQIRAYILMERVFEGAKTGIAIDGSASMRGAFGHKGCLGFLFGSSSGVNQVSPNAQKMCAYLASKLDADGMTKAIYWATGSGAKIEEIGDLTEKQANAHDFVGPKSYGGSTKLLPALRYFIDHFRSAPWGMYVFITDGAVQDLDEVKQYTTQLARDIAGGKRNDLKLVMIGVGDRINEGQMEELDDLDTGTDVDLWDHKLAAEMQELAEIFAEVVDENTIIADSGLIRDSDGNVVADYRDKGVPALLTFVLPSGSASFTLEIAGQSVTQPIS